MQGHYRTSIMNSMDTHFYKRLSRARKNRDLFECVKYATKKPEPAVLRAFVSCMFVSKAHRKAISRCVCNYLGDTAIPALLDTLGDQPAENRVRQLLLLCKLGHRPAFHRLVTTFTEIPDTDTALQQTVETFLSNYADDYVHELRNLITLDSPSLVVFAAPWLVKHESQLTCRRLYQVASNKAIDDPFRNKALELLSYYDPGQALSLLASPNVGFDINSAFKAIHNAYSTEDYEQYEPLLVQIFSHTQVDVRTAAAVFLAGEGHEEATKTLRAWLISKFDQNQNEFLQLSPSEAAFRRQAAVALARNDDREWVSFLVSHAEYDNLCERVLISAQNRFGLEVLFKRLREAPDVNKMFRPMVRALQAYGTDAQCILPIIVEKGDARLKERASEFTAAIWPGKSIEQLVAEWEQRHASSAVVSKEVDKTPPVSRRARVAYVLQRTPKVAKTVKDLENYTCQVCGRRLFNSKTMTPYAEIHHLRPLGHNGPDILENVVCVCPLCHRLFHLGLLGIDKALNLRLTSDYNDALLTCLRLAAGRRLDSRVLRYHWATFFAPPHGVYFTEDEDFLEESE